MTNRPALIIPLLNEIEAFPKVYESMPDHWRTQLIVIDNGSEDGTWQWLQDNNISSVQENHKGYGSACYRGLAVAKEMNYKDIIFMDGDGSDQVQSLGLIEEEMKSDSELVVLSKRAPHGGPWHAKFGTELLLQIVRLLWGHKFKDMGPMRGMSIESLERLQMKDRAFGWTLEMQIRLLQMKSPFTEIIVPSGARIGGKSKISGSLIGTFRATKSLFWHILRLKIKNK